MYHSSVGMEGRIHVIKHKANGEITYDQEFKNVVLNLGLKNMFSTMVTNSTSTALDLFPLVSYLHLGTGTTTPSIYDSGLEASGTGGNGKYRKNASGDSKVDPVNYVYWSEYTQEFNYGEGEAAGSWTELGLGNIDGTSMFTRALFRDANGNPTTLTVAADEFVIIFYTFRYQDGMRTPQTGTATIGDQTVNFTLEPWQYNHPSAYGWHYSTGDNGIWGEAFPFRSITNTTDGNNIYLTPDVMSSTFDPETDTITHIATFNPTTEDRTIKDVHFGRYMGGAYDASYRMTFDPPFNKKADYRAVITFEFHLDFLDPPIENIQLVDATANTLEFSWDSYPNATTYHAALRSEGTILQEKTVTAPERTVLFDGLNSATYYTVDIWAETTGRPTGRAILTVSTTDTV